ncbi:DNA cytosine methyltransferase [Microbacterium sp. NPDC077057]|uniref:DNA cytosine methyltransferase n=1 Tax=Microbacterium sp. NPDC077057 TaxID=3154763 RepID=UPI003436EB15
MLNSAPTPAAPLRIGSLFSGYGGLDLAVEHVFAGRTAWFSELNPAPARVFAHHWPAIPNLGDITQIDWRQVDPVDVVCGGFPCQDVSTVGKRAGLAPGTRSGLWAQMATAIDVLQPEWVVVENVRGLLSATARRPDPEDMPDERNPLSATLEFATPAERAHGPDPERARASAGQGAGRAVAADRAALRRWGRYAGAIRRWEHLSGRPAPAPSVLNHDGQLRPAPRFVEWLMGLPDGWVTDPDLELSISEQLTALGNGVLPRQAVRALDALQWYPPT